MTTLGLSLTGRQSGLCLLDDGGLVVEATTVVIERAPGAPSDVTTQVDLATRTVQVATEMVGEHGHSGSVLWAVGVPVIPGADTSAQRRVAGTARVQTATLATGVVVGAVLAALHADHRHPLIVTVSGDPVDVPAVLAGSVPRAWTKSPWHVRGADRQPARAAYAVAVTAQAQGHIGVPRVPEPGPAPVDPAALRAYVGALRAAVASGTPTTHAGVLVAAQAALRSVQAPVGAPALTATDVAVDAVLNARVAPGLWGLKPALVAAFTTADRTTA